VFLINLNSDVVFWHSSRLWGIFGAKGGALSQLMSHLKRKTIIFAHSNKKGRIVYS